MCIQSPLVEDKSLLLLQITLLAQVLNSCVTHFKDQDPLMTYVMIHNISQVQWFFSLIFVPVFLLQCKLLYEVVMGLSCA